MEHVPMRTEKAEDTAAIQGVNDSASGTPAESSLVVALREQTQPIIRLVAEDGDAIAGHIIFSPFVLAGYPGLKIIGHAPVAVSPEYQCNGICSALVRAGLEMCKQPGFGAVIVPGNSEY